MKVSNGGMINVTIQLVDLT